MSPTLIPSALRTLSFSGTTYPPSFGNSDVVHRVDPIRSSAGIMPQPYVTRADAARNSALSGSGTVTKW